MNHLNLTTGKIKQMSFSKIFIIFAFITSNIHFCNAVLTKDDLKRIELDIRCQISILHNDEDHLIQMGECLKNRQFKKAEAEHYLTQAQTLGLASICYQCAIILNSKQYDYFLVLGEIFEEWAQHSEDEQETILDKYKMALQNYISVFNFRKDAQPSAKIAALAIKFHDNLHMKHFETKNDCLIWIYENLFGSKNFDTQKLKEKIQNSATEYILWDFLINLDQKFVKDFKKIFLMINA
jgi:hypothetical protein